MSKRAVLYRFSDPAKKMLGATNKDPPRSYPYNPSLTRFLPWPVESLASNKTMASVDMSFIDFHTPSLPSASSSVRIPASSFEAYTASTDEHSHNAFDQELVQFDMIYFASPGSDMHPPSKPCHPELSMEVDFAGPEPDDRLETRAVTNDDTAFVNQPELVSGSEFQKMGDQGSYDAAPSDRIGLTQG
jgi:hypothetical protein